MTDQNAGNAEDLALLREKAKGLGIKNYHTKGYPRLYKEVMEAIDAETNKEKKQAEEMKLKANLERNKQAKAKQEGKQDYMGEKYYFTNPKTGKIGEYILTDKKNMIPHTDKKTAFKLIRWM